MGDMTVDELKDKKSVVFMVSKTRQEWESYQSSIRSKWRSYRNR